MMAQRDRLVHLVAVVCCSLSLCVSGSVDRTACVDGEGVMRWVEDGSEVAVFGVNYYTPFALDYRLLGERGIDRKATIRNDVAHFRRLGLTAMRLHCFDREISNRDGSLRDNDHLDLLDYLIAECASNGMYTVLTPMAVWGGGGWTSDTNGFAYASGMKKLTADPKLWKIQARYVEEFAGHVNRYTGKRYAEDPAVLCFELINEPAYTNSTPDSAIAEYANALSDGLRRSGTKKPIFYSATWNHHNASAPEMRVDGVTGVYYATGLRGGGALAGWQLSRVQASSLKPDPLLAGKAKVVYEFDAADMTGAYMYPAMAAVFRSEGVQSATQFQYDGLPLARDNESYKTHYLNLVYTPQKAISMAIAAEVFRQVPRGAKYCPDSREVVFPPFRVNAERNLSEMVTENALYYTSEPIAKVAHPERLERVWGCGSSSVAASDGSGAYFLDRVAEGLWRLQLYPNIMPVADPYTGKPGKKTIVIAGDVRMKVALPDLGSAFSVSALETGRKVASAVGGEFMIAPGDYVLAREAQLDASRIELARKADIAPYVAPPPEKADGYSPWPVPIKERAKQLRAAHSSRDRVNLLDKPMKRTVKSYKAEDFASIRRIVDTEVFKLAFPEARQPRTLIVTGRGLAGHDEPVELVVTLIDGTSWGIVVKLPKAGGDVVVRASELKHFDHWDKRTDLPKGTSVDLDKLACVTASIGTWLEKEKASDPHGFEITSLRLGVALSTGVELPEGGVPKNDGGHQYTTRMEKRPQSIDSMAQYLKWKWRMNLADPKTGLDNDRLREGVAKIAASSGWANGSEDWYDVSARMFDFLVDNVQIGFSKYDCFPAVCAWDRHARPNTAVLWGHASAVDDKHSPGLRAETDRIRREGRAAIGKDFDHSAPDWDDIFKIGFPGMKARIDAIDKDTPFYRAEKRAAAAIVRFLDRLIATAKAHPDADSPMMRKEIASLERLRQGPPKTAFDLMEFTMVYFILSEPLNYFQVRTMGNIDRLWQPYYERDIAAGRTTEAEFREEFRHFIWQFGSIDNYWGHPIYFGGVNLDGRAAYNPLSMILLDVVDKEALPTPKLQLKFGADTPAEIWDKALDMVRRHRSLVIMSEPNMMESMKAVDLPEEDAKDLLVWGCFEYLPRARGNCTSASKIIMPHPVVEILRRAAKGELNLATFEDFKKEYVRILHDTTDRSVALLLEHERHLAEVNPALVLSLAVPSAIERGVDAFSLGYDYNYTAIGMVGIGTALDSLLAVKEFVYDKKEVSLAELGRAIVDDWKGHETLQLKAKRSPLKWGCGNAEADALAKEIVETFTGRFVGKPNSRGGKFVCYGLNARGWVRGSEILASATPDGRNRSDYLSKNIAPSIGSELDGLTGSIRSQAALGPRNFPCGAIYDVMIHPSAVEGEKGLAMFRKIVERYFAGGGIAMNINVISPETLRDAQQHPEKYEDLQVRVAGWNVRWNDIPRKEQDEFIRRAESVAQ